MSARNRNEKGSIARVQAAVAQPSSPLTDGTPKLGTSGQFRWHWYPPRPAGYQLAPARGIALALGLGDAVAHLLKARYLSEGTTEARPALGKHGSLSPLDRSAIEG
jgi:hypothetical protein